jgi:hypothetical protein
MPVHSIVEPADCPAAEQLLLAIGRAGVLSSRVIAAEEFERLLRLLGPPSERQRSDFKRATSARNAGDRRRPTSPSASPRLLRGRHKEKRAAEAARELLLGHGAQRGSNQALKGASSKRREPARPIRPTLSGPMLGDGLRERCVTAATGGQKKGRLRPPLKGSGCQPTGGTAALCAFPPLNDVP